jgi:hypothetical protein
MAHLSQRKIAGRLGCSHTYIQKLIALGTIPAAALNDRGKIDPAVALPLILDSLDPDQSGIIEAARAWHEELTAGGVESAPPPPKPAPKPAKKPAKRKPATAKPTPPAETSPPGDQQETIIEANRRDAISRANMREIKEAELKGTLVNAREVELQAFAQARQLRDAILAIPDRVIPIISAETDEHANRQILDAELRSVLRDLAENADG